MVYALLKLNFFPQLETLHPDLMVRIQREIEKIGAAGGLSQLSSRGGAILFGLGRKAGFDPERALRGCFRLFELLEANRRDLMGFNILLSNREAQPVAEVESTLKQALLAADGEERIWLEDNCRELFGDLAEMNAQGDLWYLPGRVLKPAQGAGSFRSVWARNSRVEKVLDQLGLGLERDPEREGILLLVDPLQADRKLLMEQMLDRLFGPAAPLPVPWMVTLYRRRSALHPFLNSIDAALLEQTPLYLKTVERAVWNEVGGILSFLKRGEAGLCPDHLEVEFYLAYHLYLLAYLRGMEEKLLPGVFIAEGVDTYHPAALASLFLLLQDLSHHPSFLPVLIASRPGLPIELQSLKVRRLPIRQVSRGEIQALSSSLYPGLEVPRAAAAQIRRSSSGQLVPLVHYLGYLRQAGKIREQAGRFVWVAKRDLEARFPTNPILAAWSLVESLPDSWRRVLYSAYLAAGLLDREQLLGFLEIQEVTAEVALKALKSLRDCALLHGTEYLIPVVPQIRGRLRALVEKGDGGGLEEKLLSFLWNLWQKGAYTHPVLLYYYLARKKKIDWAMQILPGILKRKLDEMDLERVGIFLDTARLGIEEERKDLRLIVGAGRLRAALLAGDRPAADRAAAALQDLQLGLPADPLQAEACLQLSRHEQAEGEGRKALGWAKRALVQFQELGLAVEEKRTFLEIGAVMLAQGKLEEALEYLGFCEGFDPSSVLDEIRTLGLQAIALFLSGNVSRALRFVERGTAAASQARRREWEVLLRFLRGRIVFELGHYREALKEFQEDLTTASLYTLGPAGEILYAWMARSLSYCGETESAIRLLQSLEERPETLYFLAEAFHLAGANHSALEALEQALDRMQMRALQGGGGTFAGERIDWRDGYSAVEGRCAVLWNGRGLWGRLLAAFRAFLRGPEGAAELHAIIRTEKIPEADPHLHLYHYFYGKILPEDRDRAMDDALTMLNRALKIMQQRAARIEESTARYQYLHQNYWNGRILLDAARRKMI
jgi:tetratricopeptide (TPR) repeat protein